jgi:hypothetical protein
MVFEYFALRYFEVIYMINLLSQITRPLRYTTIMTQCRVYILIIFAWILSLIVSLARLIGFKSPEQTSLHRICEMSDNFSYALGSAALSYYIPLVVILFVYYKIFRLARAHMKFIKKSRLNTKDNKNNNINSSGANIKLLEYNNTNNNNKDNSNDNQINNNNVLDKELSIANEQCKCKSNVNYSNNNDNNKNNIIDPKSINSKFNRLKGNQIKKIDTTTMPLSNHSNHHLSSSSSFSSSKSFSIASFNNKNSTKREICENCRKYTSISLSSKIIDLKYQNGSTSNYFVVTTSTISTAVPKFKSGISKTTRILNFLRKIKKLKTEQKAAKTLGIVVG